MSITTNHAIPGGDFTLLATGPALATMTLHADSPGQWVVTESDAAPAVSHGHILPLRGNVSLELNAGERLHVRCFGTIALTLEVV